MKNRREDYHEARKGERNSKYNRRVAKMDTKNTCSQRETDIKARRVGLLGLTEKKWGTKRRKKEEEPPKRGAATLKFNHGEDNAATGQSEMANGGKGKC